MNEMVLTNEKLARKLAKQLREEPTVANVKLYRHRDMERYLLHYDCRVTLQGDQLQARAERALRMVDEGYQVVWLGDNGLVVGPEGQTYAGTLETCACADMQKRLAKLEDAAFKGACKHAIYRAVDLLVRANRAERERAAAPKPAPRRRAKAPAKLAAAV